ncbi:MAG: lytic transglycosylase domain-containing protein [Alphaproteobacteria bacterium]|nr:lytic transglycosylase domain-containing protein [Alphaproteobacteria bacterium]
MRRPIALDHLLRAFALTAMLSTAVAQAQPAGWGDVAPAIQADDWGEARRLADLTGDPVAAKVVRWLQWARSDGPADPAEIAAFLAANPGWPLAGRLARRMEDRLDPLPPDATLLQWFDRRAPETTAGRVAYASALQRAGRADDARAALRRAWVEGSFRPDEEREFLERFADALRPIDHQDRLERLVWENETVGAQRMLARVEPGPRRVAEMRLRLRAGKRPDGIDRLGQGERADPGLLLDLVRHYRRVEDDAEAERILTGRPPETVRPELWWTERNLLARRAMRNGAAASAYRIAATHGFTEGVPLAEAEFLAGWIALRFLADPTAADAHFARLEAAVSMPISRSRAAYWRGRAADALGQGEVATARWRDAARHLTTYYGQLAAERLGLRSAPDWMVVPTVTPTEAGLAAFAAQETAVAATLLAQIGEVRWARPFVARLVAQAQNDVDLATAAEFARRTGLAGLAVLAGKRAGYEGTHLPGYAFPVQLMAETATPEPALVNAVIRQESMFDPTAVSSAGARGLMQLMPATARQVARELAERHSDQRLVADPGYNVTLGRRYLANQIEAFGGSYVLAVAAYNAGPGRARQWLQDYGDPRGGKADPVDWVEMIPFNETRNYVQRVMENLQVYRWRLAGSGAQIALAEDLRR